MNGFEEARLEAVNPSRFYEATKRLMDLAGALTLLGVTSPLWALTAIAVKLEDGGPIFHYRRVLGQGGLEFDAVKFRSMRVDADELLACDPALKENFEKNYKLTGDPRITRVGRIIRKLSIDELPQALNVLHGEMSLVGPRIIIPAELPKYGEFGRKRLSVKPGITGLWQVNGRHHVPYDQRVVMDMHYIDNYSLWLDLTILFKTVLVVLKVTGE
jgi:lipopolysaccharide/colanic/teichoic acid biosynthesis glycosyltransferase